MTAGRRDNQTEPRRNAGGLEIELVIANRQPLRQRHAEPPSGSGRRRRQPLGDRFSGFEATCPNDFPTPGREPQFKLGMRRLGMNDVHSIKSQWCSALLIVQLLSGETRVGRETKSANQRQ